MKVFLVLMTVVVCACDLDEEERANDQWREEQVAAARSEFKKVMREAARVTNPALPTGEYCKALAERAVPCGLTQYGDIDVQCLGSQVLVENACLELDGRLAGRCNGGGAEKEP